MENRIVATYLKRRMEDSGRDQAPDFYVYEFTNIMDGALKVDGVKWFKETKLLEAANLKKGEEYTILLSDKLDYRSIRLHFPKEICWAKGKVYLKNGNSIIAVDEKGKETNLSETVLAFLMREFRKNKRR